MKFIQYKLDVECDNNVEREPRSEIEDFSTQLELMNPFYKVNREKPTNITFDLNEKT